MITSAQNPLVKRIRQLIRQKKARLAEQTGVIEGIRPVLTILEHAPEKIEAILIAPPLLTSHIARARVNAFGDSVREISPELFKSLSNRENPAGLAAVVQSPAEPLSRLSIDSRGIYLYLENLADPGNLGAIIRTADAAGAAGVIVTHQGVDITHPTALKASMGTAYVVPIAQVDSDAELDGWIKNNSVLTAATSARANTLIWEADLTFSRPNLIMIGNEQQGLSTKRQNRADFSVRLPMMGEATSLNVATATAVIVYEFQRRRWQEEHDR